MTDQLKNNLKNLSLTFSEIDNNRFEKLHQITDYIAKTKQNKICHLIFICTHNSRRSQIAQALGLAAAQYYGISDVKIYSGGTEITSFYFQAIRALKNFGFVFTSEDKSGNPHYSLQNFKGEVFFSKKFNDPANPMEHFCAIMTCADADSNCPHVSGAEKRIALPFEDPKKYDKHDNAEHYYSQCLREIGREIMYVFASLK